MLPPGNPVAPDSPARAAHMRPPVSPRSELCSRPAADGAGASPGTEHACVLTPSAGNGGAGRRPGTWEEVSTNRHTDWGGRGRAPGRGTVGARGGSASTSYVPPVGGQVGAGGLLLGIGGWAAELVQHGLIPEGRAEGQGQARLCDTRAPARPPPAQGAASQSSGPRRTPPPACGPAGRPLRARTLYARPVPRRPSSRPAPAPSWQTQNWACARAVPGAIGR